MVSAKVSDTAGLLTAYSNSGAKNNNSQGINFTDILKKNTVESTKTVDANESIQVEETKENYKTEENVEKTQKDVNEGSVKTEDSVGKLKEELEKSKELDDSTDEMIDDKIPSVEELSKIADMIVNIKQEISEMLGITVEELDKYLNQLSMDINQLKQPEQMIQLVMKVKNISNQAQLLVNPELSNDIKELLGELKQIVETMPEVTEEVINQIELMNTETVENQTEEMMITDDGGEELVTFDEHSRNEGTVDISGESITQKLGDMANTESGNMSGGMSDNSNKSSENDTVFDNAMNIANLQNNVEVVDGISEAIASTTGSYSDAEVISQIIERIKVTAKPGLTSMELQLYPEHLGKVTVQVVAKNGGITAQISAENENVRGIIENQLVTLKESLNEQGIKVDSVEVTVSNFGFEQNLNEQGEQSKEQAKHSNRVRKSLLEEINGVISEDVSEETRMETVGNTVSYKA